MPAWLVAFVLLAATLAPSAGPDAALAGADAPGCTRDRKLDPGKSPGALYNTVAPFEHFGSNRSQVFPSTCTLRRLTGSSRPEIAARRSTTSFATPYIASTRNRDELYVYGYGADAAAEGAFVAKVDPDTLEEEWRTRILDGSPPDAWSYPGVALVHGNGFIYADYANVLVKIDPKTGRTLRRRELPEDPSGTGAAYNGMIVLPDGRIVAKKIERGPCAPSPNPVATSGAFTGLLCATANALPSEIVVVDPGSLRIVSRVTPPEPITGRITWGRTAGRDYIYGAGADSLFRFSYDGTRLRFDRRWGEVVYRTGAQTPGTGPGLLGHFVVVQTNFLPASEPMTVTAVSTRDPDRIFRFTPFADSTGGSWIISKPALDADNDTVITHDTTAARMAALRLDPRSGFSLRWQRDLRSLSFAALVGGAEHRQIVIPDSSSGADEVVWLDEATGRELARSAPLASAPAPGNIVTPGFSGRFFYLAASGELWRLQPQRR